MGFGSGGSTAIFPSMIPALILDLPDIGHHQLFNAIKTFDATSHFLGCGKKIARAIHQDSLTNEPSCFTLGYLDVQKFERFVVIVYSKACVLVKVNEARHGILQVVKKNLWRTHHRPTLSSSSV